MMTIVLASIASRSAGRGGADLIEDYTERSSRFSPCSQELFADTTALWNWVDRQSGRGKPYVTLLDSTGRQMTSEVFAERLGRLRDDGIRQIVLAIGPADGWTAADRKRADLLLSFGPMTLPHQLARVVLAEQVYRALTILAGHPYHSGH